jgi:hypothetical protein
MLLAGVGVFAPAFAQTGATSYITNSANLLSGANFNIDGSGTFGGNVNFSDATHSIFFPAAGAGAGYPLSITGEQGATTYNGGDIDITGGIGDPSSGTGGNVNISGGLGFNQGSVTVNGTGSGPIFIGNNSTESIITMDVGSFSPILIGTLGYEEYIDLGSPVSSPAINMDVWDGGNITIGTNSYSSNAIGFASFALGFSSIALGDYYTLAGGDFSVSIGSASANGNLSIAIGNYNPTANGTNSIAMGGYCVANDSGSFVYGDNSGTIVSDSAGGGTDSGYGANSFTVLASGGYSLFDDASGTQAMSIKGGKVGINTAAPRASLDVTATDAIIVPVGTTAQRPGTPVTGMIRFNTTSGQFEGYNGSAWVNLSGNL